ncbi:MAG: hypothetical protein JW908_12145 [Anaerolineales bacterium]|nr:hypothetical protein [Anaerolineales bacterium]
MTGENLKPLNWTPTPNIGYTVHRRSDGGMHYTFTDVSRETLKHWRDFSVEHLMDSDRLTRNLYDLRQIAEIPDEAIDIAVELANDPSARNIRLAVVVADEQTQKAIQELAALIRPGGLEMGIFIDVDEADRWLNRPLTQVV